MLPLIKRWFYEEEGLAATEAAMIFPILCMLLLGVFDMGHAILASQKTIRASQVVADLVARESVITSAGIDEAVVAGRLALEPLDTTSYGVDIVSIRFDETNHTQVVWRETVNMTPISDVAERVASLASPGEGVVMVAVEYSFEPVFANFITSQIDMQEVGFSRGRQSAVVNLAGSGTF